MKLFSVPVISNTQVLPGMRLLWVHAPEAAQAAQAGQFVMVRCTEGFDPLLRRPVSIHRTGPPGHGRSTAPVQELALLFGSQGSGTSLLARLQPGEEVDLLGPLGQGFAVHRTAKRLLLVGSGWGVAPLVMLADQGVREGRSVTLLLGAATAEQVYPLHLIPPEVEVVVCTEDGSLGHKGRVTDILTLYWEWMDQGFACGPMAMYRAMASQWADQSGQRRSVQVLLEAPMACGVGACYACAVPTRKGLRLACTQGPRAELWDIL